MALYTITYKDALAYDAGIITDLWEALSFIPEASGDTSLTHRSRVMDLIAYRYNYREIGYETTTRFKEELKGRLLELTNKYTALYAKISVDDIDLTKEWETSGTNTSKGTSKSKDIVNSTPLIPDVDTSSVADSVSDNANETTGEGASSSYGRNKDLLSIYKAYAMAYYDIDNALVNELNDLFMRVY